MGPLRRWLGSHIPQQRPAQSDLAISWVGKNRIEKRLETLLFSNQVTQKKNIILIIYYQSLLSSLLLSLSLLIFPSKIHFFGKQWSYKSKTFFHKFSIRLPMTPVDWLRCHKGPGFHRSADFGGWRPAFSRPIRKGRHVELFFVLIWQFGNLKQILFFCVVDAIFCENKSLVPSCLVSSTFGCPQYPQTTWRFD